MADGLPETGSIWLGENSLEHGDESLSLLIERAKAGDASAFDRLIICCQPKVISIAWRMLGNTEDAKDAMQEAFLRAYKYLHRFDNRQPFRNWLYRITINVCRDMLRRRARSDLFTSLEAEQELGNLDKLAGPDDPEAAADLAQCRAMIARALDTLSEKERAVIVLRDLEGLSTEEVARIMGSSKSTVRAQLSSARLKIARHCDRARRKKRRR